MPPSTPASPRPPGRSPNRSPDGSTDLSTAGTLSGRAAGSQAPPESRPNRRLPLLLFAAALVSILFALHHAHFDWGTFYRELQQVAWLHIAAGVALIYGTYWLRAARWAELCRSQKHLRPAQLVGAQFVGFTAVALFGRLADLARPYILARRTGLSTPSQVAVYTVERIFDLGAAAVVFSSALAFTPAGLPHRDRFVRVGVGSLAATLVLATFAVAVRLRGPAIAAVTRRLLARLSPAFAASAEDKILAFRSGLGAISTLRALVLCAVYSLTMWGMIGATYWQTTHSFALTPELAHVSFSRAMLLMAASLGGSLLQLPGLGWFTQIAATAAAMHAFYGAPLEAATACGALLLLVTSLSIVPAGLLFARLEGINLREATTRSEAVEAKSLS